MAHHKGSATSITFQLIKTGESLLAQLIQFLFVISFLLGSLESKKYQLLSVLCDFNSYPVLRPFDPDSDHQKTMQYIAV